MNRKEVLESIALKKKFCKDCGIPISVYDNPYFYQRLQILDPIYNGIKKFMMFCSELEQFENEQEYFAYYNQVKDSVIDSIKSKDAYLKFIQGTYEVHTVYDKRNLYVEDNNEKAFISIDMKKANFSALNHYSDDIFDHCNCWEEFISRFTNNNHIISSKYIRQVIMGACNPGKQIQYERFLMSKLLNHIVESLPMAKVFSLGDDEIILSVGNGCGFSFNELKRVILDCHDQIGRLVTAKVFNLEKINGTNGWAKFLHIWVFPSVL